MKIKVMITIALVIVSLTACSIKGEEICGIWDVQLENGEMQIEITPWQGTFYGYLLKYQDENDMVIGRKEDEFVIIKNLEYNKKSYSKGIFYWNEDTKNACDISFTMIDKNRMKAVYDCNGEVYSETWNRKGFNNLQEPALAKEQDFDKVESMNETPSAMEESKPKSRTENQETESIENKSIANQKVPLKLESFDIIGLQKMVSFSDDKAIEKVMNELWEKTYNEDFSNKLEIKEPMNMYMVYSNYGNPKGMMTMTLGYKVSSLSKIPKDLKGIHISSNEYYSSALSGKASDYEGEEWNEIENLMEHRNPKSADFEVYTFDNNYKVTEAFIWIAAK